MELRATSIRLSVDRLYSLLYALGLVAICGSSTAFAVSTASHPMASPSYQSERMKTSAVTTPSLRLALPEIDPDEIQGLRIRNSEAGNKRLQIGIGRDIEEQRPSQSKALGWTKVAEGHVARWEISSPNAKALRLVFRVDRATEKVELRFSSASNPSVVYGPFTSADLFSMGTLFWSPVLEGAVAQVELFVAGGDPAKELALTVVQVSHMVASPASPGLEEEIKAAAACELNLICRSSADASLANAGKAVAKMTFSDGLGGSTYLCTGTLLASTDGLGTPYFYSATHCIDTQVSASTLTTHWLYESTQCSSNVLTPSYVQTVGGATLLYQNTSSDVLLLRLNQAPPGGVWFSGWDSAAVSASSNVTGIHHPVGDYKKVSIGAITGTGQPTGYLTNGFNRLMWSSGVTEQGSSGSGIFTAVGSPATDYRLRGGLWGGASSCTNLTGADTYSRFDLAFPSLSQYLNPVPSPGVLQFVSSSVSVSETAGTVVLQVSRAGGTAAAVTVTYFTTNGTAVAGSDFTSQSGTLSWAAGDAATKTIVVPITSDAITELPESFVVTLSTPTGGATLGTASSTVSIFDPSSFRPAISAGDIHTCALDVGGNVLCWGWSLPSRAAADVSVPTVVRGFSRAIAIASGYAHTCVITEVGGVQCVGSQGDGVLGNGGLFATGPVHVSGLATGVRAIATGEDHSCALTNGGAVQCWGSNVYGQLGINNSVSSNVPVLSAESTNVTAIAVGTHHSCALRGDGTVRCWGRNNVGQLGNNSTVNAALPTPVAALAGTASAITAGGDKTCILTSGGTVQCWGDGVLAPATISALAGVAQLEAGGYFGYNHACAVVSGGGSKCWGDNGFNQLGNGGSTNSSVAVNVAGLSAGTSVVTAGGWHSCALMNDGTAKCWGYNHYGQLGNNSTVSSSVPVSVFSADFNRGASTTTLTVSPSSAVTGQMVLMTAAISGLNLAGSVEFSDGGTVIQGCHAVALVAGGTATCNVSTFPAGSRSLIASYSGDSTNAASVSTTILFTVKNSTSTTVTSSANPATTTQTLTFLATVGGNSLTGSVTFKNGTTTISACSNLPAINGGAACTVSGLAAGTYGITASYSGDALNASSTSNMFAQVIAIQMWALTAAKTGTGTGTVTSSPAGLNCGLTCTASFTSGALVNLSAVPAAGSIFAGWSGGGCSGTAQCAVAMSAATTVTAAFSNPPRLVNIATRMQVLTGDNVLIGGFIISGSTAKTVVVRARGPSMIPLGVPNALANPTLALYSGQTVIASNDNFGTAVNLAALNASGFAPADALESAILVTLNPGPYTAIVSGVGGTTGVGIVEVFEVDRPDVPLVNIATRGQVLTGSDVMIGGFIIQGSGPQAVVVRARGPSLTALGVPGALANPVLNLYSGQTVIASNDDWQTATNAATLLSSGFAPSNAQESAILITLNPGAYTAIVSGAGGTTGVGIVEVFTVP